MDPRIPRPGPHSPHFPALPRHPCRPVSLLGRGHPAPCDPRSRTCHSAGGCGYSCALCRDPSQTVLWADCTLEPSPAAGSKCPLATCSHPRGWKPLCRATTQCVGGPGEAAPLPGARLCALVLKSFTKGNALFTLSGQDQKEDFAIVRNSGTQIRARRSFHLTVENLLDSKDD